MNEKNHHKPAENNQQKKKFKKEINYLFVNNYESTCSNCLHIFSNLHDTHFSWVYCHHCGEIIKLKEKN